jgi:hypothetical protein
MRLFVAVTDSEWFNLNASNPGVDKVNFWCPSLTLRRFSEVIH